MQSPDMKGVGERIYKLRTERGWSQFTLGQKSETSQGTVQRYECSRVMPQLDSIARIARALGVTLDYLVWGGGVDVE